MTSETLPMFSGDEPTCPKCANVGASTQYRAYGTCIHAPGGGTLGHDPNERLHRHCGRCGYAWDEAIAGAPADTPDPR